MFLSDCVCVYKDAVYIELAGSHALEDEGATPTNAMVAMVTSMQGAELPLDSKMEHATVSLLKVYIHTTKVSWVYSQLRCFIGLGTTITYTHMHMHFKNKNKIYLYFRTRVLF